ncbi:hypothetical protein CWB77_06110 [Pseudoalteromonas sp. S1610]|uniref:hypothetical protein n=1 Tax=unclassified Pseudoalteromonas TaxID=194690 RepID=UPI00110A5E10|nr:MULTISPECIES: hypothetical protein [unclassified Pseudoalteromonas]MCK8125170.1 hypothetical protein [Pseudoalteromonas sp. 2CM39R]TMP62962.1 hypothetical protein CWB77_06110 [Pseudoalteromonas sp. S1610]
MESFIEIAPAVSVFVALMALSFQLYVYKKNKSLEEPDQKYRKRNVFFSSKQIWNDPYLQSKPECKICITNQDSRDVVIDEILWSLENSNSKFEIDQISNIQTKLKELMPIKLAPVETFEFQFDPETLAENVCSTFRTSTYMKAELISRIRVEVNLSTGENETFFIGPQLQLYMLNKVVKSWFFRSIGQFLIRRAHNKKINRT